MALPIRHQLTLFVPEQDATEIEQVRNKYNPQQQVLIACHVTLCREDELQNIDQVIRNLNMLSCKPVAIHFGVATRFNNGKGVLLPAAGVNEEFHMLRNLVLEGISDISTQHEPHITLLHPRNATCNDEIFGSISAISFPDKILFPSVSLIEQVNGGKWSTRTRWAFHL